MDLYKNINNRILSIMYCFHNMYVIFIKIQFNYYTLTRVIHHFYGTIHGMKIHHNNDKSLSQLRAKIGAYSSHFRCH